MDFRRVASDRDWIELSGPPDDIELVEKSRRSLPKHSGESTIVSYHRADNPAATYHKIIESSGKEKWGKLRPLRSWFPIPGPPAGIELREFRNEQWLLPQGWRTVVSYYEAGHLRHWYEKIINPEGDEWREYRHPADDELT
jgi:hypothetical protein